jgi:hypothetical protein
MTEYVSGELEGDLLAWVVLRAANRTQARGSTVRLVIPRAPEVTQELGAGFSEEWLLDAEEYLLKRGYVALADVGLTRGAYTITPAGYRWLERDPVGVFRSLTPHDPVGVERGVTDLPETAPDRPEKRPGLWRSLFGA